MSFRWKTILGVALIEAALLMLLLWSANYYLRFSNENQLARHVQTTLELLETASRDAVLSSDLATLDEIAREAESMPGLTYIRILASDGLVLAAEIMVVNSAVRALIRDDKAHQIYSVIQTGGKQLDAPLSEEAVHTPPVELLFGRGAAHTPAGAVRGRGEARLVAQTANDKRRGRHRTRDDADDVAAGRGGTLAVDAQPPVAPFDVATSPSTNTDSS